MSIYLLRGVSRAALYHLQPLAVVSGDPKVGEVCRAQTEAKAQRLPTGALTGGYNRGRAEAALSGPCGALG